MPSLRLFAGPVERGGTGVDKVQKAAGRWAFQSMPGHALDGIGRPVGADIGEQLRRSGKQMAEQHGRAVQGVVFRSDDVGLANAVPIETCVKDRLHEVAVREMIRPLPLPLKARRQRVVALRLFGKAQFGQTGIARPSGHGR